MQFPFMGIKRVLERSCCPSIRLNRLALVCQSPGQHPNFCLRRNLLFGPPTGLLPSKGLSWHLSRIPLPQWISSPCWSPASSLCPLRTKRWTPVHLLIPMLPKRAPKMDLNNCLDLKHLWMLLGMRQAWRLKTGFLSRRMRKTYLPHETFGPLEPCTWLTYHGRLLTRMMIWHWGKLDEMEGRWRESES